MSSPLKKLASETAIYGLSTILARMINFLIVPLYTRVLTKQDYGSSTEIMSYIAVLQVVLVLGLETGCFRFANKEGVKDPQKPFSTALSMVAITSMIFFALMFCFSTPLANVMGYKGYEQMFIYVGGLMALDSITAILFARLRYMQKALKFAIFKTIKIFTEVIANLALFFVVPSYLAAHPNSWLLNFIPATPDFSYIIFAIFISCIICMILFIPDILKMKLSLSKELGRQMFIYSLPLMIAGLPGILNDSLDRILFRFYMPEGLDWRAELGVFQAAVKLSVIMNLFIQMFRYAAEPFFFARGKNRELLAQVMEYFVAFCLLIFLGIVFYIDIIGLILGSSFRGALGTVPFMLFSYMILGMLFNVSMWYKLSGATKYAILITFMGLVITAIVNILLMPYLSYWASVYARLLSVLVMLIYSVYLGNKYYPIPYRWLVICKYILVALVLYGFSMLFRLLLSDTPLVIILLVNTLLLGIYLVFWLKESKLDAKLLRIIKK